MQKPFGKPVIAFSDQGAAVEIRGSKSVLNLTLLAVSPILLILFASGCSNDKTPKRYEVSGTVLFDDDAPVRTGIVEFIPMDDGAYTANGEIQRDGTFKLRTMSKDDGAVPGKYKVIVKQFIFYDKVPKNKHDHGGNVSRQYADFRTTPLTFEVKAEANSAKFVVGYLSE